LIVDFCFYGHSSACTLLTLKIIILIGPLLFCNTVQPLTLQADLNLDYLEDVTLGGQVEMVASDVAEIVRAGSHLGLSLNVDKCELVAH